VWMVVFMLCLGLLSSELIVSRLLGDWVVVVIGELFVW